MGLLSEAIGELRKAVQFAGIIEQKVDNLGNRIANTETDIEAIMLELRSHGERIAKVEKAEETLAERTALHLEVALAKHHKTDGGPSLRIGP